MTDISLPLTFDPDSLDPEAAELLPRLASADAAVRRIALLALADLEDETVLGPIVAALRNDPSAEVRAEAAQVLGAWQRADVIQALCEALTDRAEDVRDAAALEPALAALAASEDVVRLEAVGVLGWLKSPRALGALTAIAADDPNADVRRAAIGALGVEAAATEQTIVALLG